QTTYGVKLQGEWSAEDLSDLDTALATLSGKEKAVLKGYVFIRVHQPSGGKNECGWHQADFGKNQFSITMYDGCFKDPEAVSETMMGKPIGEFNILHEIGHAMDIAEYRQAWNAYNAAVNRYNELVDQANAGGKGSKEAGQAAAELDKKIEKLKKAYEDAKDR